MGKQQLTIGMNRNLTGHNGFGWTRPEIRPQLVGGQTGRRAGGCAWQSGRVKDLNKSK